MVGDESDRDEVCVEDPIHVLDVPGLQLLFVLLEIVQDGGQLGMGVPPVGLHDVEDLLALHFQLLQLVFQCVAVLLLLGEFLAEFLDSFVHFFGIFLVLLQCFVLECDDFVVKAIDSGL